MYSRKAVDKNKNNQSGSEHSRLNSSSWQMLLTRWSLVTQSRKWINNGSNNFLYQVINWTKFLSSARSCGVPFKWRSFHRKVIRYQSLNFVWKISLTSPGANELSANYITRQSRSPCNRPRFEMHFIEKQMCTVMHISHQFGVRFLITNESAVAYGVGSYRTGDKPLH